MIASRLLRPSLTSRTMASGYSVLNSAASAPSSANYQTYSNGTSNATTSEFTPTALNRWSVANKTLPPVDTIRALHVYDFDNTLFKTPLPNASLWQGPTIGQLQNPDVFTNGGWWHDPCILSATGSGIDVEEPRAWEGWWNEKIVELVRLSMADTGALTILLTGRSETNFGPIIKRIVKSKELDFAMVGLKPLTSPTNQRFQSTMHFKQIFLNALMETYKFAEEIRIYEDRPKHTKGFRDFLEEYNRRQGVTPTRGPIKPEVIQVADKSTTLDPVMEVAQIQTMINGHNAIMVKEGKVKKQLSLNKQTLFTSYIVSKADREKLLTAANLQAGKVDGFAASGGNILISFRPPTQQILDKIGGMGAKMTWRVTAIGCWQDKVWAALLEPEPRGAPFHVMDAKPWAVLGTRKGGKPIDAKNIRQWDPLPNDGFLIETTIGERVVMRIEQQGGDLDSRGQNKRKHPGDDNDHTPRGPSNKNDTRGYHTSAPQRGGRGRGRGDRGNNRGGRGRGRGGRGGGNNHYRSLDDVSQTQQGGSGPVSYDDAYPSLGPRNGGNGGRGGHNNGGQDLQNYY